MLITVRGAALVLEPAGLNFDRTRMLLATGVAGAGIRTTGGTLYDEDRVRALAGRTCLEKDEIAAACPGGILVGRVARGRSVDVTDGGAAAGARGSVRGPWRIPLLSRILLRHLAETGRPMPMVATVSGFILVGAEVVGFDRVAAGYATLQLGEPGAWFEAVRDRRWLAGRGGPALLFHWPSGQWGG